MNIKPKLKPESRFVLRRVYKNYIFVAFIQLLYGVAAIIP